VGYFAFSRLAAHIRVLSKSGEKPTLPAKRSFGGRLHANMRPATLQKNSLEELPKSHLAQGEQLEYQDWCAHWARQQGMGPRVSPVGLHGTRHIHVTECAINFKVRFESQVNSALAPARVWVPVSRAARRSRSRVIAAPEECKLKRHIEHKPINEG
jgi:hypothetical protein